MEKTYFKQDAKSIVDMFFDAQLFKGGITRDDMNDTEKFICEMMQMKFDSHLRLHKLTEHINKSKK